MVVDDFIFEKNRRYKLMMDVLETAIVSTPPGTPKGSRAFTMPSCFLAFILIDSLNLSDDDIDLLFATVGRGGAGLPTQESVRLKVKQLFGREKRALRKRGTGPRGTGPRQEAHEMRDDHRSSAKSAAEKEDDGWGEGHSWEEDGQWYWAATSA